MIHEQSPVQYKECVIESGDVWSMVFLIHGIESFFKKTAFIVHFLLKNSIDFNWKKNYLEVKAVESFLKSYEL